MCAHCIMFKSKHDLSGTEHLCVLRWKGRGRGAGEGVPTEFYTTDKGVQNHWAHYILILFALGSLWNVPPMTNNRPIRRDGLVSACVAPWANGNTETQNIVPSHRTQYTPAHPSNWQRKEIEFPKRHVTFWITHKFRDGGGGGQPLTHRRCCKSGLWQVGNALCLCMQRYIN